MVKKNLGIQLVERKERNIIKNFGYELMVLNGSIPKELYEELEMEEVKNKKRKFDKSTMKTLHSQTMNNYKRICEKNKIKYNFIKIPLSVFTQFLSSLFFLFLIFINCNMVYENNYSNC